VEDLVYLRQRPMTVRHDLRSKVVSVPTRNALIEQLTRRAEDHSRSARRVCRVDCGRARQETQDAVPLDVWPRQKIRPGDECRARGGAREPLIDEESKPP